MLRFEMDVAAADLPERTIEGVVVPYNEVGRIGGADYRFLPGSLSLARSRTPLLVDHDRARPVGVLAELVEQDDAALGRFKIDATQDGDTALVQAASGSRGALSVGAEVLDSDELDGVTDVKAARIVEVSLLALGAFASAGITRAEADEEETEEEEEEKPPPHPDQEELELEPEEESTMTEASGSAPVIRAERERAPRELSAGQYVHTLLEAQRGDREAVRLLEAVLTETISTDIPGILPPQYETGVIGPSPIDRVLYQVFRGRPLPGVGLTIQKPTWTTFPNGAWAATVDDDATTGKAVIGLNAATIERWDWATAISYMAVKRSSPDALDTIYKGAVENFYQDVETKIAALLDATAGTPNAAVKLGAGIAAFYVRCGRAPEVAIVAPDVWGLLADAGAMTVPFGFTNVGGVQMGDAGLSTTYAGMSIIASGAVAVGTKYLATRRALDVRISEPVQLTANAIGALNVELGVVGEGLFDADVALEVMELTTGAPIGLSADESGDYDKFLADAKKAKADK